MSKETDASISALLDGELPPQALDRTLSALAADDRLRREFGRYQLIGDAMRGEVTSARTLEIADAVRARLAQEPTVMAPRRAARPAWRRPAAGVALAASVAAVAIALGPRLFTPDTGGSPSLVERPAGPLPTFVARTDARLVPRLRASDESRLSRYLVDHNEYANRAPVSGFMPYATFVGYDGGR